MNALTSFSQPYWGNREPFYDRLRYGNRAGLGGLGDLRGRRGLGDLGVGGAGLTGLGALGLGGTLGPSGGRRDHLNHGYRGLLTELGRGAQYPDLSRGAFEDLLYSRRGYRDHDYRLGRPGYGLDPDCGHGICGSRYGLGSGYDYCRRGHRCDHDFAHGGCRRNCCPGSSSNSTSSKELVTKDILVRGKTHKLRKSFLAEASKFEGEFGKYLDKKNDEQVPEHIVEMLIDYINTESCSAKNIVDLVTMNVLASSLGVRSAVEFSLAQIKKVEYDYPMNFAELTNICITVLLSSKVDEKLVEWLKKYLKYDNRWMELYRNRSFRDTALNSHPELELKMLQLVEYVQKDDSDNRLRIL